MPGVFTNYAHNAFSFNDLAFNANLLYRGSDFHRLGPSLLIAVRDPAPCQIVWRQFNFYNVSGQYLDEMHPHLP